MCIRDRDKSLYFSCGTTQFAAKPPLVLHTTMRTPLVTGGVPVASYLAPGLSPHPRKAIHWAILRCNSTACSSL